MIRRSRTVAAGRSLSGTDTPLSYHLLPDLSKDLCALWVSGRSGGIFLCIGSRANYTPADKIG